MWSLGGEAQSQVTDCSEEWKNSDVAMEKQQIQLELGKKKLFQLKMKDNSEVNLGITVKWA